MRPSWHLPPWLDIFCCTALSLQLLYPLGMGRDRNPEGTCSILDRTNQPRGRLKHSTSFRLLRTSTKYMWLQEFRSNSVKFSLTKICQHMVFGQTHIWSRLIVKYHISVIYNHFHECRKVFEIFSFQKYKKMQAKASLLFFLKWTAMFCCHMFRKFENI